MDSNEEHRATLSGKEAVSRVIAAAAQGNGFMVYDDRGGRGTLLNYPASTIKRAHVSQMMSLGSGLVSVAVDQSTAVRCGLPLMMGSHQSSAGPAFTVSVNARWGRHYGVSEAERWQAIRVLANPLSSSFDLVKPGHVFPILVDPNGLLGRQGLAEASADLVRWAKLPPIVAMSLMTDGCGEIMALKEVWQVSQALSTPVVALSSVIDYRLWTVMSR